MTAAPTAAPPVTAAVTPADGTIELGDDLHRVEVHPTGPPAETTTTPPTLTPEVP